MSGGSPNRPPRTRAEAQRDLDLRVARERLRLLRVDQAPIDPARPFINLADPARASAPKIPEAPREPRPAIHGPMPRRSLLMRLLRRFR